MVSFPGQYSFSEPGKGALENLEAINQQPQGKWLVPRVGTSRIPPHFWLWGLPHKLRWRVSQQGERGPREEIVMKAAPYTHTDLKGFSLCMGKTRPTTTHGVSILQIGVVCAGMHDSLPIYRQCISTLAISKPCSSRSIFSFPSFSPVSTVLIHAVLSP